MKVEDIVIIAICAALSMGLGFVKVFEMPNGGDISLWLMPLMFAAVKLNFRNAFVCCLITAIIQLIYAKYLIGFFNIALDYIIPACLVSLLAFFKENKKISFSLAILTLGTLMFSSYVLSGVVNWEVNFIASLIYNITYFAPMFILNTVVLILVLKKTKNIDFNKI